MADPFIRMRNVSKTYRSRSGDTLAVSDVTLDVEAAEMVSLVGPSGCGMTTML